MHCISSFTFAFWCVSFEARNERKKQYQRSNVLSLLLSPTANRMSSRRKFGSIYFSSLLKVLFHGFKAFLFLILFMGEKNDLRKSDKKKLAKF
jgi:hypothetical protein